MDPITANDEPEKPPDGYGEAAQSLPPLSSVRPTPEPPRRDGASLTQILILCTVVGIVAGMLGSFLGSKYVSYKAIDRLASLPGRIIRDVRDALDTDEPTFITLPPAIEQLKPLSRLQTEEYFLSTVIEVTRPRGAGGVFTEKLVLIACGWVTAGVDLTKIDETDISSSGSKVTIKLPPAEIFATALEEESGCTRVYDRSVPALMSPSEELDNEARRKAIEIFRQTALENGILEKAQARAQEEIARLLLLTGYKTIEFSDTGDEILLPQE
jgi:hypothetical protein